MGTGNFFDGQFFGGGFFGALTPTPTPGRSGLGGDDVPRRKSPHKGWSRKEWQARVKDPQDAIEDTLRDTYAALTGDDAALSTLAQVDSIVRPIAARPKAREAGPVPITIDWQRMARDFARANALMRLAREESELRAIMADDDDLMMMLT